MGLALPLLSTPVASSKCLRSTSTSASADPRIALVNGLGVGEGTKDYPGRWAPCNDNNEPLPLSLLLINTAFHSPDGAGLNVCTKNSREGRAGRYGPTYILSLLLSRQKKGRRRPNLPPVHYLGPESTNGPVSRFCPIRRFPLRPSFLALFGNIGR